MIGRSRNDSVRMSNQDTRKLAELLDRAGQRLTNYEFHPHTATDDPDGPTLIALAQWLADGADAAAERSLPPSKRRQLAPGRQEPGRER